MGVISGIPPDVRAYSRNECCAAAADTGYQSFSTLLAAAADAFNGTK